MKTRLSFVPRLRCQTKEWMRQSIGDSSSMNKNTSQDNLWWPLYIPKKKAHWRSAGSIVPSFFFVFLQTGNNSIDWTYTARRYDEKVYFIPMDTQKFLYLWGFFFLLKKKGEESNHGQSCSSSICTVHRRTPWSERRVRQQVNLPPVRSWFVRVDKYLFLLSALRGTRRRRSKSK